MILLLWMLKLLGWKDSQVSFSISRLDSLSSKKLELRNLTFSIFSVTFFLFSSNRPFAFNLIFPEIEQDLKVPQPPLLSIHPLRPLFEACQLLIKTHARRLPLLDFDEQTGMETVVSVLTQYRVLKFIAMNVSQQRNRFESMRLEADLQSHLSILTFLFSSVEKQRVFIDQSDQSESVPTLPRRKDQATQLTEVQPRRVQVGRVVLQF